MSKEIEMFEKFLKQLGDSKEVQSKGKYLVRRCTLIVVLPLAGIPTIPSSHLDVRAQRKKGKTNKGGGTSVDKYVWVDFLSCTYNFIALHVPYDLLPRAYKRREGMQLGKHQNSHVGGRMCMNAHVHECPCNRFLLIECRQKCS